MNYGGIEAGYTAYENAKFVVIPVPYDLTSTYQSGSRRGPGAILDASYAGAALTTIVWRRDADPWWRPVSAMLVLPDMLDAETFRRLRVWMRYGQAPREDASSDDVAPP